MSDAINEPGIATLQADLAALKQDMASLMAHLKESAASGAQQAAGQIDEKAQLAYRKIADQGERSVKAVTQQIEDQPLLAMVAMLAIGFAGGRLLSR